MFKKAEKKQIKLKLALTGVSGSGKTYSALRLASGLGGKIAIIDSENGSASLYSDRFTFDVCEISPPFTSKKYMDAIDAAIKAGYEILIIDSLSHEWASEGGILDRKSAKDQRGGNSFTNWKDFTDEHNKFTQKILQAPIHTIATMRSKQEYALVENEKGKKEPKKLGLAPIQRDGQEYEYTVVFDIAINHSAEASKDRTGMFDNQIFTITEETGKQIKQWLLAGKDPKQSIMEEIQNLLVQVEDKERREMIASAIDKDDSVEMLPKYVERLKQITKEQECQTM